MKKKLLIIFDILFRNGQYLKATKDLYVKDNLYIKESIVSPVVFVGRTIVSKGESDNIPENIIYNQALINIFKERNLIKYLHTCKFDFQDADCFISNINKVAYEVQLTIIPANSKQH